VGGFLQALLEPLPGLNVNAGLRHDDHSRFGGATTFAANASFRPGEGPIRLRASYGEGFKAPTLFQLFSEFGNEGLRPERATGWDAGVDLRLVEGNFRAGLTWFERRTRDQIDFQSCFGAPEPLCADGRFGFYANLDRTSARGLEAVLGFDPAPGLVVDAQYSYVDARNRAEGDPAFGLPLLRRPEHSLSAIIDYRAPAGWSVGATLAHLSSSIDEDFEAPPFGRVRLEGHVLADVRAGLALTEGLELYGRVTNLFDERYETVLRYGQPGRQAFIGIRARY
jgi:vitamin B12 transporter